MKLWNWPHALIGFLIGVALIIYLRGGNEQVDVVQPTSIVETAHAE